MDMFFSYTVFVFKFKKKWPLSTKCLRIPDLCTVMSSDVAFRHNLNYFSLTKHLSDYSKRVYMSKSNVYISYT